MPTFVVERTIPALMRVADRDNIALHCRWAKDAYHQVGASWLGGVITEDRMFSLVVAEQAEDLRAFARGLRIADQDITLRQVVQPLGPFLALPLDDPQYRPPLR